MSALSAILALPAPEAAPLLLGWRLRSDIGGERTEIVLTEVEAYAGASDRASHAAAGRTARNESMFGAAGTLYVYRSYGIHWCMNVVVEQAGDPAAVLLRGGTPVAGADVMARRRGRSDHLSDGPGKLCQALGVNGDHDGTRVGRGSLLELLPGASDVAYSASPRVGITKATDRLWRFVARGPE